MAEQDGKYLEYKEMPWGDLITGTKEQLQALGLGIGIAFPGEEGATRRAVYVKDPRGFRTRIAPAGDKGRFFASISFPGWESPEPESLNAGAGVTKRERLWCDEYVGTAEALVTAGLVKPGQFPGQPGMRRTRVTILPDGTPLSGAPTVVHKARRDIGAKVIERASRSTFSVLFFIDDEEHGRRWVLSKQTDEEYEARMLARRRPQRLCEAGGRPLRPPSVARSNPVHRVPHLRLVWSAGSSVSP